MTRKLTILFTMILFSVPLAFFGTVGASFDGSQMPATDPVQIRPAEGERRLVVLLADNAGTETTDLLVPHGILRACRC